MCVFAFLHLTPQLFILGIDLVGYATGQTDKFRGTGVFSGIQMERPLPTETKDDDDDKPATPQSAGTTEPQQK